MPTKRKALDTEPPAQEAPKTDSQLLFEINSAIESIRSYTKQKKAAEAELLFRRSSEISELLKAKPEPYGSVNIMVGNHKLTVTVPKKVVWDQEKLGDIRDQMLADRQNPDEFISCEYSVSETKYKAWPEAWKDCFKEARTVQPGNPTIKMEE